MAKYLLLISLGFLLCFAVGQNASSTSLLEALEFVTLDTTYVSFTNWELIKRYEGADNLSGQDSLEKRNEFYKSLFEDQAAASAHGKDTVLAYDHTEVWGWDTLDLRWEILLEHEGAPVYVLALRQDFDSARLEQLLKDRHYQKTTYPEYVLYSHELELKENWVLGELSIFNVSILEGKNMLVLSSSPESVQQVLDNYGQDSSELYKQLLQPLGGVVSAILSLGALCSDLSFAAMVEDLLAQGISQEVIDKMKAQIESSPFHPYLAFALGYRYEDSQPLGIVVMDYANAVTAESDLAARRMAADEGLSLRSKLPYREAVFELKEARVEDTAVVLELLPFNHQPKRLFDMVYTRDMSFAACP